MKILIKEIDYTDLSAISDVTATVDTGYSLPAGAIMTGRIIEFDSFFSGAGNVYFGIGTSDNTNKWYDGIQLNNAASGNIITQDGTYEETEASGSATHVFYGVQADSALTGLTGGHCRIYLLIED